MSHDNDNDLVPLRTCTKCIQEKPTTNFNKKKDGRDDLHSWCKRCVYEYQRSWYLSNKEAQDKRTAEWRKSNPQLVRGYQKRWRTNNKDYEREKGKNWKINNPEKYKAKEKRAYDKRMKTPRGRLEASIRAGFKKGLLPGTKAGKTFDILGYTADEIKAHLEKQFQPGMTWETYGKGGWEIDHIIPLAAHNYESPNDIDFKKAWAISNLRPLWASDNRRKSDKLLKPFQPSLLIAANDNRSDSKRNAS